MGSTLSQRIYSSPSHLGFTDKFTAASTHFYFDEAAADPDDVHDESTFCMIGHDAWVLRKHQFELIPRGTSLDWSGCVVATEDELASFLKEARHNDAVRRSGGWSVPAPVKAAISFQTSDSAAPAASQELAKAVE